MVDKIEQILWANNQHSVYNDYCHIGHTFTTGWIDMQQSMAVVNKTEEGWEALI